MSWTTPCATDEFQRSGRYAQGDSALSAQVSARPTPTVQDGENNAGPSQFQRRALPLNAEVVRRSWPTPTASDASTGYQSRPPGRASRQNQKNLATVTVDVHRREWPTPTVNGNNNRAGISAKAGDGLATAAKADMLDRTHVKLSARWVARLMGYPDGWLDVDDDTAPKIDPRWPDGDPLQAFAGWDTIPRVVTHEAQRAARIRALGNAVVPQIPFTLISEIIKQEAA